MAFETGSIFAKLKFDESALVQGIKRAKRAVDSYQESVRKTRTSLTQLAQGTVQTTTAVGTFAKGVAQTVQAVTTLGRSTATVGGGVASMSAAIGQAAAALTTLAASAANAVGAIVSATAAIVRFSGALLNFARVAVTGAIEAIRRLIAAFVLLGRTARGIGRFLTLPFRFLSNVVTRSIFSLKNLLLVFGAALFIRRAKEVETIARAFDNLSRGVGIVSQSFIRDLRGALRGTVSDLEIMRTTNNALLLGVVQSQEQFVRLAETARRLGRAVGRNAVDALNDLSIGIGRQSRLILDNLGLVVKVEKANEDYAAALGKTASELTSAERRQAFLNATITAAEAKLRDLGPDILSNADQWDRLGASINNTITALAGSLVGGDLPRRLADFFDRNRQSIVAFAEVTLIAFQRLFRGISDLISRFFRGELNIGDFLGEVFGGAVQISVAGVVAIFNTIGPLALQLLTTLFTQLTAGVVSQTTKLVDTTRLRIAAGIGKISDELGLPTFLGDPASRELELLISEFKELETILTRVAKTDIVDPERIRALREQIDGFQDLAGRLALDADFRRNNEKALSDVRRQFVLLNNAVRDLDIRATLASENDQLAEEARRIPDLFSREIDKAKDVLTEGIERIAASASSSAKSGISDVGDDATSAIDSLRRDIESGADEITASLSDLFSFRSQDPLSGFRPLVVDRLVQPLANVVNELERLTRVAATRAEIPFTEKQVLGARNFVKALSEGVIKINDIAVAARRAVQRTFLDPAEFASVIRPFQEELEKINSEAAAERIGSDLTGAFQRLRREIQPLLADLTKLEQMEILELIDQNASQGIVEAAVALDNFNRKILPVIDNLDEVQRRQASILVRDQLQAFFSRESAERTRENLERVNSFFEDAQQNIDALNFNRFEDKVRSGVVDNLENARGRIDDFLDTLEEVNNSRIENIISRESEDGVRALRRELEPLLSDLSSVNARRIRRVVEENAGRGLDFVNRQLRALIVNLDEVERSRIESVIDRNASQSVDNIRERIAPLVASLDEVKRNQIDSLITSSGAVEIDRLRDSLRPLIADLNAANRSRIERVISASADQGIGAIRSAISGLVNDINRGRSARIDQIVSVTAATDIDTLRESIRPLIQDIDLANRQRIERILDNDAGEGLDEVRRQIRFLLETIGTAEAEKIGRVVAPEAFRSVEDLRQTLEPLVEDLDVASKAMVTRVISDTADQGIDSVRSRVRALIEEIRQARRERIDNVISTSSFQGIDELRSAISPILDDLTEVERARVQEVIDTGALRGIDVLRNRIGELVSEIQSTRTVRISEVVEASAGEGIETLRKKIGPLIKDLDDASQKKIDSLLEDAAEGSVEPAIAAIQRLVSEIDRARRVEIEKIVDVEAVGGVEELIASIAPLLSVIDEASQKTIERVIAADSLNGVENVRDAVVSLLREIENARGREIQSVVSPEAASSIERLRAFIPRLTADLDEASRKKIDDIVSSTTEIEIGELRENLRLAIADIDEARQKMIISVVEQSAPEGIRTLRQELQPFISELSAAQRLQIERVIDEAAPEQVDAVRQKLIELEAKVGDVNARQVRRILDGNVGTQIDQVRNRLEPFLDTLEEAQRTRINSIIDDLAQDGLEDAVVSLEQFRVEMEKILPLLDEAQRKRVGDVLETTATTLRDSGQEARQNRQAREASQDLERRIDRLANSTTDAILGGLTEALIQGEDVMESFSKIGADLFRNFMGQAIDDIGNQLSGVLKNVLGSEGAAGFAGALIGIGGLILSNLENKTRTTIDDFGNEITSSEAIRGVVAGPSNVAISKVNEGLKAALRTVEILLQRIANAVERNSGVATGGGAASVDSLSLQLSSSSQVR